MMNFRVLISLPLVDEENKSKGVMYRWLFRYPRYLPRIGERIYVRPGLAPKVQEVQFDGPGLFLVHLWLEPVSNSYRGEIENTVSLKGKRTWKWKQNSDSGDAQQSV